MTPSSSVSVGFSGSPTRRRREFHLRRCRRSWGPAQAQLLVVGQTIFILVAGVGIGPDDERDLRRLRGALGVFGHEESIFTHETTGRRVLGRLSGDNPIMGKPVTRYVSMSPSGSVADKMMGKVCPEKSELAPARLRQVVDRPHLNGHRRGHRIGLSIVDQESEAVLPRGPRWVHSGARAPPSSTPRCGCERS